MTTTSNKADTNNNMTAEDKNTKMSEDRKFLTKLFEAALNGQGTKVKEYVLEYIQNSGDSEEMTPYDVLSQFKDAQKRTALHFACQSNKSSNQDEEDIVSIILDTKFINNNKNIEKLCRLKDKDGLTPIMLACQNANANTNNNHEKLTETRIKILLENGGSKLVLARSHAGATPLHYAAGVGASSSVIDMLCKDAKIPLKTNSLQGGTPLHWSCSVPPPNDFSTTTIKSLLKNANDANISIINIKNDQGMTPVVMAIASSNDKHAKYLIEYCSSDKIDISIILPGGTTLFHMAADLNLVGTLSALLDKVRQDEDTSSNLIIKQNDQGETPLDLAVQEEHLGCVMLLLPDGQNSEEQAKEYITKHKEKRGSKNIIVQTTPPPSSNPTTTTKDDTAISTSNDDDKQQANTNKDIDIDMASSIKEIEDAAKQHATKLLADKSDEISSDTEKMKHNVAKIAKMNGNELFMKKEYNKAIDEYTKAIDKYPYDETYYSNRSACYICLKKPKHALYDGIVARTLKPDWPKACYRMSIARLDLHLYEDAALSAWEGLQLDQENDELKSLLQKCVKLGRKEHQQQQKGTGGGGDNNDKKVQNEDEKEEEQEDLLVR